MRFVEDIYSLYRDQLGEDEDNAISVVISILEDQYRNDMMKLIKEMEDDEVIQMVGMYLVEMLKMKMAQDGKLRDWDDSSNSARYH
ncbi:hypothetical protein SAMN05444487_10961 [Marininema mesophilum]|uniref:Cytosolic protein n=1 Tax=Marininema mesophilum TaxID=1048340 RepID=A0A1H2YGU1_9BACL|nr:DUF6154 family protein [Marininema mesophilum]SDX04058.1 hypothetical protein SAMN05444487_10961 [Marininema mesophilum]